MRRLNRHARPELPARRAGDEAGPSDWVPEPKEAGVRQEERRHAGESPDPSLGGPRVEGPTGHLRGGLFSDGRDFLSTTDATDSAEACFEVREVRVHRDESFYTRCGRGVPGQLSDFSRPDLIVSSPFLSGNRNSLPSMA